MEAKVGDRLVVESAKVATPRREGEILEVHGQGVRRRTWCAGPTATKG